MGLLYIGINISTAIGINRNKFPTIKFQLNGPSITKLTTKCTLNWITNYFTDNLVGLYSAFFRVNKSTPVPMSL